MVELSIRVVGVEVIEELNSVVVAFREGEDGGGHGIELQRSLVVDEQDRSLGLDTYCVTASDGACVYGGVRSCVLDEGALTIKLSAMAQAQLGVDDEIRLNLLVPEQQLDQIRGGLAHIFEEDQPGELRLS